MNRKLVFGSVVVATIAATFGAFLLLTSPLSNRQTIDGESLLKSIKHSASGINGTDNTGEAVTLSERKSNISATGIITLDDGTFASGYDELYDHREKYSGREISIDGYVETDHLPSGEFLVGRDLVWCCQSDKYFIGFLVLTNGPIPRAGSTLRVTGKIESSPYTDPDSGKTFDVPSIRMEKAGSAAPFSRDVFPM